MAVCREKRSEEKRRGGRRRRGRDCKGVVWVLFSPRNISQMESGLMRTGAELA